MGPEMGPRRGDPSQSLTRKRLTHNPFKAFRGFRIPMGSPGDFFYIQHGFDTYRTEE
jgi:hypothetical protein